uniref:Neurotransmitter-gated ion-channel ligand-binding domain-containing protein n=1 Tax=Phlebotomus papatasi TaxID=29031 RepID=A0A1B0CZC6_PHLPP
MKLVSKIILLLGALSVVVKFSLAVDCEKTPKNNELRLKKDMLCTYDKSVRPNGGSKNATIVKVKMVVKSYDYVEYNNHINVFVWMVMAWTDDHFKWDPREYGNLKTFYEMSDQIWMPDLSLYNGEIQENSCETTNCVISSTGSVICVPPCKYSGHCAGSFTRWPYDRQNCTLNFGAWINTGEEINFVPAKNSVETTDSLLNHEWKLVSISMKKHDGSYACCPNQTFPSLRYNFILERHASIFTVYLLIPTIVLFYRDSTAIIGILALNTIIVRILMGLECDVPHWLSSPVDMVKDSAAGKFVVDPSKIKMEKMEEGAEDDTAILVEPKANDHKNTTKWNFVASLIDRLVLII